MSLQGSEILVGSLLVGLLALVEHRAGRLLGRDSRWTAACVGFPVAGDWSAWPERSRPHVRSRRFRVGSWAEHTRATPVAERFHI